MGLHSDDIILPSYDSISSIRSALARYEAWQYNNNQRHNHNQNNMNDDFMNMMPINNIPTIIPSLTRRAQQRIDNNGHNNYQYNVPFYNPFLRIRIIDQKDDDDKNDKDDKESNDGDINMNDDDDNKMEINTKKTRKRTANPFGDDADLNDNKMTSIFPLSHYQQNRTRNTNIKNDDNDDEDENMNHNEMSNHRNDLYQRYRPFNRYRHTFRALQHHNHRRRSWNQNRTQNNNGDDNDNINLNNDNLYFLPQLTFGNDTMNNNQFILNSNNNNNNNNIRHNFSRISNILTFNSTLSDDDNDNNIKLKVVAPKLKHNTSSRLDGLQDFKAAFALIPLRLTSLDPFGQKIYSTKTHKKNQKQEMDDDDDEDEDNDSKIAERKSSDDCDEDYDIQDKEDKFVISGIDKYQNFLSQLSSDLHLIILNMLTGLGYVRTLALYNSLRSELTEFDMDRIRNCSVYKCQALFIERYRQNLFDEKYKAERQPALTRALSTEPRNLLEFQKDRKARVLRRQSSISNDDEKSMPT